MAETRLVPAERARFYTVHGERRDGVDLRAARRDSLLPSLTEMLRMVDDYGLRLWREHQLLLSGATTPRLPDEDDVAFCERVHQSASEERQAAAERGIRWHRLLGQLVTSGVRPNAPADELPMLEPAFDWVETHLALGEQATSEHVVVNEDVGYAGTTDYCGVYLASDPSEPSPSPAVVDFKSQNVKLRTLKRGLAPDPSFYMRMVWQLAGYAMGLAPERERRLHISLIVSSNPDCPGVWPKIWAPDEVRHGERVVRRISLIWHELKGFGTAHDAATLRAELVELGELGELAPTGTPCLSDTNGVWTPVAVPYEAHA